MKKFPTLLKKSFWAGKVYVAAVIVVLFGTALFLRDQDITQYFATQKQWTLTALDNTHGHLKMEIPDGVKIRHVKTFINTGDDRGREPVYTVLIYNGLTLPEYTYIGTLSPELRIYLQPKPGTTLDQLKEWLPEAEVVGASNSFGMGSEVDEMLRSRDLLHLTTAQEYRALRYVSDWGSGASKDIAAYLVELPIENRLFSRVLIDGINVWPEQELPAVLNNEYIVSLQKQNDPRVYNYTVLDKLVRSFTLEE